MITSCRAASGPVIPPSAAATASPPLPTEDITTPTTRQPSDPRSFRRCSSISGVKRFLNQLSRWVRILYSIVPGTLGLGSGGVSAIRNVCVPHDHTPGVDVFEAGFAQSGHGTLSASSPPLRHQPPSTASYTASPGSGAAHGLPTRFFSVRYRQEPSQKTFLTCVSMTPSPVVLTAYLSSA